MSHRKDGNGCAVKEWRGHQPLPNLPSLIVESLRVARENGLRCDGSLALFDSALSRNQQYLWEATYMGPGGWQVIGKEAGAVVGNSFSPNKSVNFELKVFVQDRLNMMRREGAIFRPQLKPGDGGQPKQPPTPPPPPPPPVPPSPPQPSPPASKPAAVESKTTLPGAADVAPPMVAVRIPVNRIRPNPAQPRKRFRQYALKTLMEGMKKDGQRQLIDVVRILDDPNTDYELITGERRWRAAQIAGITHLNAIVKSRVDVPDRKSQHHHCFIADFQREGYSDLEVALALMEEKNNGATVQDLCKICGRSNVWVYQHLALNDLVPELKGLLDPSLPRSQQLSFTIGCRIARVPKERQMEVYRKVCQVVGSRLQLIEANELVAEMIPNRPGGRPRKPVDCVRRLRFAIPRLMADVLTTDGYDGKVFASLVEYSNPQDVVTILDQINTAVKGLATLKEKIVAAQKRHLK